MSQCPRCSKRVFFAERKNSLGQDWHRQCLTCEACSKVLNPGQHAEHKGVPYCEVPCYKSIFGPKLYGFGSQVESHDYSPRSGRRIKDLPLTNEASLVAKQNNINISMSSPRIEGRAPQVSQDELVKLQEMLKIHNDAHPQNFINLIEKDRHVSLEGLLRVHWGVQTNIKFKQDDSHETTSFTARLRTRRVNKTRSFHNDLYASTPEPSSPVKDPFRTLKSSGIPPEISSQQLLAVKMKRGQFHTIRDTQKCRRRFSINGHYYKNETSDDFTPAFGSVTQVFVGSHLPTVQVIKRLLDKFKIENGSSTFALYMVKSNGEMWPLTETVYPLMERVRLQDPSARIFLMDRPQQELSIRPTEETTTDQMTLGSATISDVWKPVEPVESEKISHELAGFLALPEPMLVGFMLMFNNEQRVASEKIVQKYENVRSHIKKLMSEKQLTQETYL